MPTTKRIVCLANSRKLHGSDLVMSYSSKNGRVGADPPGPDHSGMR